MVAQVAEPIERQPSRSTSPVALPASDAGPEGGSPLAQNEPIISSDDRPITGDSTEGLVGYSGNVAGAERYTWQDGDRSRTVTLRSDMSVAWTDDGGSAIVRDRRSTGQVDTQAGGQSDGQSVGQPVFQSDTGQLMTLPGGVLLVFVPEWNAAQITLFFIANGVDLSAVESQSFTTNAYFIQTEPGFPSLTLANELAGQDGVLISSPNWQTEVVHQ